jgi:hypothetical protein
LDQRRNTIGYLGRGENSIGIALPSPNDTLLCSIWNFEHAQFVFQHAQGDVMVLCINPKTKETLWVLNLKEAFEFYEKI